MSRILRTTGTLVGMMLLATQPSTRAQDNKANVFAHFSNASSFFIKLLDRDSS